MLFVDLLIHMSNNVYNMQEHTLFDSNKVNAFQCDLTQDQLTNNIPECSVDLATLIFVLSAVHPDKMLLVLQNIRKVECDNCFLIFSLEGFIL